jgi:spoIIIJ-associated protein
VNAGVEKTQPGYLRVRLDIAGYRNRREGELVELANRTAKEVARTGRSHTLPPMNPYERLIVHTAVGKIEGVASESIGSDVERRVVVKSTQPGATRGDDWNQNRRSGGPHKGGQSHASGGGRGPSGRGGSRDNKSRERDRDRGGRGGPRPERPSSTPEREYADAPRDPNAQPVVPKRREAIRDGDDLPLYGKIEV